MKILSIRLKNLASIEGCFDIDFTAEPLASAGIFAISGPTGAGKSTILDALCLALYDRTPRFAATGENLYLKDVGESQINQSDVKNILRRGAGEGFAEVTFLAVDGRRYLSRWSVRRARGKATGSLQPQTLQVQKPDTGEELQGTKTELLSQLALLVGLTYEQFTRTVLLAQNDFATFLKSRESAKAELLEKLTGTEIYSQISRSIFARSKSATEALNQLKGSISLIELLPEEELNLLREEKAVLTERREAAVKLLARMNDQLKVITSLSRQQEQLAAKRQAEAAEAGNLKKKEELLAGRTANLSAFRQQWEALQPELKKARELDTRIQAVQAGYSQAEPLCLSARKRKEEARKELDAKETALSRGLSGLTAGDDSAEVGLSAGQQLERAEALLSRYGKEQLAIQQDNDGRVVKLNAFDIRSLSEEQSQLVQEQKRLQTLRQQVSDWLRLQQEAARLTQELSVLGESKVKLDRELTASREQLQAKNGEVAVLQRLYENARLAVSRDTGAIRQHLVPGEACPVCGSKEHPYALGEETAGTMFRDIEKEYQAAAGAYQQLNNRVIAQERDSGHLGGQQAKLQSQLTALHEAIARQTPEKEEERNTEYIDTGLGELQRRLNELSGRLKAYQQLYEEWQQVDRQAKAHHRKHEELKESIATCRLLLQQVASEKERLHLLATSEADEHARFTAVRNQLDALRQERSALLKGKPADEAEAAVSRREKELNELLESARKESDTQKTLLSGLQGEIKLLSSVVEELAREKEQIEEPDKLPVAIRSQEEANRVIGQKLSVTEARLMQQEQNRARLKTIEEELKEKQAVAERWEKLNKLIGSADGTKFKVIAQSYTLNLLLMHANKHLSYLSKRYKLQQVPDTLALQVIDCDMCDEVRTVYSLSGGESFLISLALALGLSSLSSRNLRVESLFIDEGFGSLDAESLRTAMEALEQLQMQGRKIGVISHVQEMSERIPVQIQVQKTVNGKSGIKIVS